MGLLHYAGSSYSFDDRMLAHLQVVVSTKLRRRENFFVSWRASQQVGDGRHAIWVDNGVAIHFEYFGSKLPLISRELIETMITMAGSSQGLVLGEGMGSAADRPS
jgi:hypothetical protein